MGPLNHESEPWLSWIHPTTPLVDFNYTVDIDPYLEDMALLHQWVKGDRTEGKQFNTGIAKPVTRTARAFTIGAGLAAADGPLPIMDIIGFSYAVASSIHAWYDYLVS